MILGKGFNSKKYGFLCYPKRCASVKHKKTQHYQYWTNMLTRCYDPNYLIKYPTYKHCKVCDEWLDYQEFALWIDPYLTENKKGWHLDKDLLFKGNKIYSPETCVLVPEEINLILGNKGFSSELPVGVTRSKVHSKFMATLNENGKPRYLGIFNTPEEASSCYIINKELQVRAVAEQWKDSIDFRLYTVLSNFKIN